MKSILLLAMVLLGIPSAAVAQDASDHHAKLHELFAREWEARLEASPLFSTSVGRHEFDHLLDDVSPAAYALRAKATAAFLEELKGIDRQLLDREDQISYDIFRRQLEIRLADIRFRDYEIPLNADSGFHSDLARLPANSPFRNATDYENYVARLRAIPVYVSQHIANMRAGMRRGMILPQIVLVGIEETISPYIVESASASGFFAPLMTMPAGGMSDADIAGLRNDASDAITSAVVPAYREFYNFIVDEYIPVARQSLGASELPDGEAYYRHKINSFTTLDLSPTQIHEIGLSEVARIREEMQAVIDDVAFDGSFSDFLSFLRTDSRFYAKSPEELLREAAYISKRMDGKLPSLFKTLPRLPYGVEPVPAEIAAKYTAGRYVPAPSGGTRAGLYWVNTYDLRSRPLYNLEALSLHEAVPGHHLQIALNRELEDLPNFRRFSYISAFGEGWGLYSEWLGIEAGFYTDPYSNFGRLTYEMWRACRLVVDTGIHAFGWTREQTMSYLADNTALPLHEVKTETDRYISWPGQALSYKLGELKIRDLRRRAEDALGSDFDIRAFHDVVLLSGSVPLTVLDESVQRYIVGLSETSDQ